MRVGAAAGLGVGGREPITGEMKVDSPPELDFVLFGEAILVVNSVFGLGFGQSTQEVSSGLMWNLQKSRLCAAK